MPRIRSEPPHAVVVGRDLITASRIAAAAAAAGFETRRVDDPGGLPPSSEVAIAFVDWGDRQPGWASTIAGWLRAAEKAPRVVLLGSHRDLAGHREARAAGLGPVMARSKLFASLPSLFSE